MEEYIKSDHFGIFLVKLTAKVLLCHWTHSTLYNIICICQNVMWNINRCYVTMDVIDMLNGYKMHD